MTTTSDKKTGSYGDHKGMTDYTKGRVKKAFLQMEHGYSAISSFRAQGLSDETFYRAIRNYPEMRAEYDRVRGLGAQVLQSGIIDTVKGKIFMLERAHPKLFGKSREQEIHGAVSADTKKIMVNPDASLDEQLGALAKDYYEGKIPLGLFDKLTIIAKMAHPDTKKTEMTGAITINEGLVPTR